MAHLPKSVCTHLFHGFVRTIALTTAVLAVSSACVPERLPSGGDNDDNDDAFPPPDADLFEPVGTTSTLDVMTWNIRYFPAVAETPALVADVIASADVDLIVVQEITSTAAFNELDDRLVDFDGVLSPHVYFDGTAQKIGMLYRTSVLSVVREQTIFEENNDAFPRPPLQATFAYDDGTRQLKFTAIGVHLKAGDSVDESERRAAANASLASFVAGSIPSQDHDTYLIIGDFNDDPTQGRGIANFEPYTDNPAFEVLTLGLAQAPNAESFLESGNVIDHIVATRALSDMASGAALAVPAFDVVTDYRARITDHLPIAQRFAIP